MVDHAIDVCKDMNVESIYAIMLQENTRAISLTRKMGFDVHYVEDGTARAVLDLKAEDEPYVTVVQEETEEAAKSAEPLAKPAATTKETEALPT
jgi:hypothetical protein